MKYSPIYSQISSSHHLLSHPLCQGIPGIPTPRTYPLDKYFSHVNLSPFFPVLYWSKPLEAGSQFWQCCLPMFLKAQNILRCKHIAVLYSASQLGCQTEPGCVLKKLPFSKSLAFIGWRSPDSPTSPHEKG